MATLELEDGTCISFYVNPVGFDKLTSTAPCCAWIIKPVQGRKGQDQADGDEGEVDSDDEAKDDGCFMSIKYDEYDLTAESIASLASAFDFDAIDSANGPSDGKTDLFCPADLRDGHVEASGHLQPEPMDVSILD